MSELYLLYLHLRVKALGSGTHRGTYYQVDLSPPLGFFLHWRCLSHAL